MKINNSSRYAQINNYAQPNNVGSNVLGCMWWTGALFAVTSAAYTPTTMAQSKQGVTQLEEVIVTARRRDEVEQDVPIAMKAMSEDYLRMQNITQIEDLGTKVPSLRISGAGGSLNEPLISLRGQRPSETVFNQDQAVPLYFNEVAMSPTQGSNLGMYDLQSVQVLKGPQGTLFGRNSTGGAILMTPKRPGTELGGYAEMKIGDYDLMGFEGAVDLPLTENLQARIAVHKLDRDGYQENIANNALHGKTYGDEHSEGARLTLNFDYDGLTNLAVFAFDENDIAAAVPYGTGLNPSHGLGALTHLSAIGTQWAEGVQRNIDRDDPWKVETDLDSREYVKNIFASNTTEYELTDNLSLKNVFGYRKVDFETATDTDGTAAPAFGSFVLTGPNAVTTGSNIRPTTTESEFFSNEFQLLGSLLDDQLEWIAGAYWSKMDATQDYLQKVSYFGGHDSGITSALNTSYGLFAEGTYAFNDEWSLTAGVRQSWDKRELALNKWNDVARTQCGLTGPGGAVLTLANCEREVDESYSAPTYRVSANYTPADLGLIYTSVSTGYRAGGFNTRGDDDATLEPFDEELVITYEIGHKNDWDMDWGSIRTNVAAYWQDYEDIHQTRAFDDGSGTIVTRTENAAKAEIKGVEFDVTVAPSENLLINLSYSYVDAEFKEKLDLIGVVETDTSSNEFTYIPKQSATASVTYSLPLDASLGDMSLMVNVYWQDEMSTHLLRDNFGAMENNGNPWAAEDVAAMTDFSTVDSYEVWNARFDWRNVMGSNFDLAAYVNNIADEQYVLGGLNAVASGGFGAYMYGAPRTVGASLRYTF